VILDSESGNPEHWYKGLTNGECLQRPQIHELYLKTMISKTTEYSELCELLLENIVLENSDMFYTILAIVKQEFDDKLYVFPLYIPVKMFNEFITRPLTEKQTILLKDFEPNFRKRIYKNAICRKYI
jgi:hypothetical protein